jgi:anti-anti-sigma factor
MTDMLAPDRAPAAAAGAEESSAPPPTLEVGLRCSGKIGILKASGELIASSIAALHAQIDQLSCSRCTELIVDLHDLAGIDSVGVNVLVGLHHYLEGRGGRMATVGASDSVASQFSSTPLARPRA